VRVWIGGRRRPRSYVCCSPTPPPPINPLSAPPYAPHRVKHTRITHRPPTPSTVSRGEEESKLFSEWNRRGEGERVRRSRRRQRSTDDGHCVCVRVACDVCDRRCSVGFGGAPRTLLARLHIGAQRPPVHGCDGCKRERGIRLALACVERASEQPATQPAGRLTRERSNIRGGIPWYQPNAAFRRVRVQTVYIRSCQSRGR